MFQKITSTVMSISFIALATSGLAMIILNSMSFQLKMHPVHKVFGLIFVIFGVIHILFNFKHLYRYIKIKLVLGFFIFLSVFLVFLYVVGLNKNIPNNFDQKYKRFMMQGIKSR